MRIILLIETMLFDKQINNQGIAEMHSKHVHLTNDFQKRQQQNLSQVWAQPTNYDQKVIVLSNHLNHTSRQGTQKLV